MPIKKLEFNRGRFHSRCFLNSREKFSPVPITPQNHRSSSIRMVMIEPQVEGDNQPTSIKNPPKLKPFPPSSSSSKTASDSSEDTGNIAPQPATSTVEGHDSDGFETASERGLSDSEPKEESNGNDDQLKQNALVEASDKKLEGNKLFGDGRYEEALVQYEIALETVPNIPSSVELRSICHSNRAICFLKLGKYEETIKECTKALDLNSSYVKALIRRAEAHEKLEHFDEAIVDMKQILELDPSNVQARKAIDRLEPLAAEKREKLKEEMIAKAKDIGNVLLGKIGLSIDNFKAVKDPNTGSYSISFQR